MTKRYYLPLIIVCSLEDDRVRTFGNMLLLETCTAELNTIKQQYIILLWILIYNVQHSAYQVCHGCTRMYNWKQKISYKRLLYYDYCMCSNYCWGYTFPDLHCQFRSLSIPHHLCFVVCTVLKEPYVKYQ